MRWTEYAGTPVLYEDMVQYEYTKDENGRLVHYLEAKKGFRYFCVECGGEMIKCKGDRLEYFRHKDMSDKEVMRTHNHDTYLHNLAELYFSERCKEGKLMVKLRRKNICTECQTNRCTMRKDKVFNIMDICDYVGIEQTLVRNGNTYRADILLKTKDKGSPVLIEIWVTHKCTDQKMEDCKVFEVKIESEEGLVSAIPEMEVENNMMFKDTVKVDNIATICRNYYDNFSDYAIRNWKKDLMSVKIGSPELKDLKQVCLDCSMSYMYEGNVNCNRHGWECPVKKLRFSPYYPKPGNYTIL